MVHVPQIFQLLQMFGFLLLMLSFVSPKNVCPLDCDQLVFSNIQSAIMTCHMNEKCPAGLEMLVVHGKPQCASKCDKGFKPDRYIPGMCYQKPSIKYWLGRERTRRMQDTIAERKTRCSATPEQIAALKLNQTEAAEL